MNNKQIINNYRLDLINKNNKQALSNKGYKYYVINIDNSQILSGWEYKDDAIDDLKQNQLQLFLHSNIKVYTKRAVKTLLNKSI